MQGDGIVHGPQSTAIDLLVSGFLAAWNERDPAARQRRLCATWHEHGLFEDALVRVEGRDALHGHIARCQASHPQARFVARGDAHHHHGHVRIDWALVDAGGTERLAGCSVGELDEAARRIRRLVAFFTPAVQR